MEGEGVLLFVFGWVGGWVCVVDGWVGWVCGGLLWMGVCVCVVDGWVGGGVLWLGVCVCCVWVGWVERFITVTTLCKSI